MFEAIITSLIDTLLHLFTEENYLLIRHFIFDCYTSLNLSGIIHAYLQRYMRRMMNNYDTTQFIVLIHDINLQI